MIPTTGVSFRAGFVPVEGNLVGVSHASRIVDQLFLY